MILPLTVWWCDDDCGEMIQLPVFSIEREKWLYLTGGEVFWHYWRSIDGIEAILIIYCYSDWRRLMMMMTWLLMWKEWENDMSSMEERRRGERMKEKRINVYEAEILWKEENEEMTRKKWWKEEEEEVERKMEKCEKKCNDMKRNLFWRKEYNIEGRKWSENSEEEANLNVKLMWKYDVMLTVW